MSSTMSIKLGDNLYYELDNISKKMSKAKSDLVVEALKQYIEDVKNSEEADQILKDENPEKWVSHAKIKRKYLGN
jgi:predicted DNA-binding protein